MTRRAPLLVRDALRWWYALQQLRWRLESAVLALLSTLLDELL